MLSPSDSVLPPGGVITQEMRVVSTSNVSLTHSFCNKLFKAFNNSNFGHFLFQATLRMRIRISYVIDGVNIQEQTEVSGFPDTTPE